MRARVRVLRHRPRRVARAAASTWACCKEPIDVNIVLGVMGGAPATPDHLHFIATHLPKGAVWKTTPISQATWPLTAMALGMGGNVRVGLEDNFYLPSGEMVKSNGELVAQRGAAWRESPDAARPPSRRPSRCWGSRDDHARSRQGARRAPRRVSSRWAARRRSRKQHERGKLTARERMDRFFDDGKWFEIGIHGTQMAYFDGSDKPPADAVICGYGHVDGRMVCAAAYDFTVKGGSIGQTGEIKVTRLRELALRNRDARWCGSSTRRARASTRKAGAERRPDLALRRRRRTVPRRGDHVGRGAAGRRHGRSGRRRHRLHPGLGRLRADGEGHRLDGARRAAAGQGGHRAGHQRAGARRLARCTPRSRASATSRSPTTPSASASIKEYLSFFPSHCEEKPPIVVCNDPVDRRDEQLLDLLPESTRQSYDMYELIEHVVDYGRLLDLKPKFAARSSPAWRASADVRAASSPTTRAIWAAS